MITARWDLCDLCLLMDYISNNIFNLLINRSLFLLMTIVQVVVDKLVQMNKIDF